MVDRFRFLFSFRNSFQGAKSIVMQTFIGFGPNFREEGAERGTPSQGSIQDFCLGGKSILKNFWTHAAATEKIFRTSRGFGGMFPWKIFEKISVQDWLKSHF